MAAPKGNKYAVGNSGREKDFESPEAMQKVIEEYFEKCDNRVIQVYVKSQQNIVEMNDPEPYSIEGLCAALGICRGTLSNYEKGEGYEEFFTTVRKAKLKVLADMAARSLEGKNNAVISIFLMKNNFGYTDKTETDIKTEVRGLNNVQTEVIFKNYAGKNIKESE